MRRIVKTLLQILHFSLTLVNHQAIKRKYCMFHLNRQQQMLQKESKSTIAMSINSGIGSECYNSRAKGIGNKILVEHTILLLLLRMKLYL